MAKVQPRILSGFMELSPAWQIKFNQIMDTIRQTYESFGFSPLDTPVIELSEVLLAKAGGETEKQIYRFTKGDTDMSLRFDLTVPLARFIAMHQGELAFPFKRYQIGKVYRGERAQKGRFREFYQCDIDVIGADSLDISYDAEMPAIICSLLKKLGLKDFKILISNRRLMSGLMKHLGLSDKSAEILRLVDKIRKIGEDKVIEEIEALGIDKQSINTIIKFISIKDYNKDEIQGLNITDDLFIQGIKEIDEVIEVLNSLGVDKSNYEIDFTITRGLDYYTGTVYETILTSHPEFGSICSGGRYDSLADFYTDKKLPGVGISIGLTRLFDLLMSNDMLDRGASTPAEVMVLPITDTEKTEALSFSATLREAGLKVFSFTESGKKFKAKLNYANKLGVPFVAIIGEEEAKEHKAVIKNMNSGEQKVCLATEVSRFIQEQSKETVSKAIIKEN